MEHVYYADRPTVPNTQHNAVHLPAILEHSLLVNLEDIHQPFYANAVEIKDEDGQIQGTLLYVGGVSFATLMSEQETEDDVTDGIVLADEDGNDVGEPVASSDAEALEQIIDDQDKYIEELEAALENKIADTGV